MPQSPPDGLPTPENTRKTHDTGKILNRIRKDVKNNPNVAEMSSEEILERFRKEVKPLP
jgi:hypothetical protein